MKRKQRPFKLEPPQISWPGEESNLETTDALSVGTKVPGTPCDGQFAKSPTHAPLPRNLGPTLWCTDILGLGGATVQDYLRFEE